jgi:hypothetical protein
MIRPTFKPGKYFQAFPSPPIAEKLDRPRHQQTGWEEGGGGRVLVEALTWVYTRTEWRLEEVRNRPTSVDSPIKQEDDCLYLK